MPLQALKAYALGKELAFKMRAVRADRMFVSRIKSWIMSSVLLLLPGVAWASPPGLEHEPTTQSQERVERFERPLDFEAPLTLDLGLRGTRRAPALPDLRDQGLAVSDFVWMMPADKAHLYTQYGVEGLAALWKADTKAFLTSGGVLRLCELVDGYPLRPKKPDSTAINQLLAHRLVNQ